MSGRRSPRSVSRPVRGGPIPLKPRRRFAKSPAQQSPAKTTDREEIPQPKDYKFAIGETVVVYFDERAKRIIGVLPWKNAKAPLSKVSTYGKIIRASNDVATVAFTRPSGDFSARLKSSSPMSVDGGFPLFALLNSNFVADEVERFDTKSTRSVGESVKVFFDPISGKAVEESTIYSVMGKIVKPGVVEVPKVEIKTIVVRGTVPKGKRLEVFLDGDKVSLKRMSPESVRVAGTVVDSKDGVSTVSYMKPRKNDGQYVKRYSPTNVTGKFVTDPRFVRRLSPDQQRSIAMYKPPVPPLCVAETFDPRSSDNCFVRGVEKRIEPIVADKRRYRGSAGANPQCDFSSPKVGAHQMAIYEFARILASRSPKEISGIRGMLCFHSVGSGKCLHPETDVIMYSGKIIKAKELRAGMELMGMDSTPRRVLDIGRGREMMYEITPVKGEPWKCNETHVLSLVYNDQGRIQKTRYNTYLVKYHEYTSDGRGVFRNPTVKTLSEAQSIVSKLKPDHVVDIPLNEYLELPKHVKNALKLFRSGPITFPGKDDPLFDPYVLGAWLGDGWSYGASITIHEKEGVLVDEIAKRISSYGLEPHKGNLADKTKCDSYHLSRPETDKMKGKYGSNDFLTTLKKYDLLRNKHIPDDIKTGSISTRLQVLAGLLDTDGYLDGNCFEITQENKTLSEDIAFVARSLGFAAYIKQVQKSCMYKGEKKWGTYHKVSISGEGLEKIPTVLERKCAKPRQQVKDARRTGFSVEKLDVGEYIGPVLDKDHRYLLGDFTVTHNTVSSLGVALAFWGTKRNIVLATTPENNRDNNAMVYAENLFKFYPDHVKLVFKDAPLPEFTRGPFGRQVSAFGTTMSAADALKRWCSDKKNVTPMSRRIKTFSFTELASALGFQGSGAVGRANPDGEQLLMGRHGKQTKKGEPSKLIGSVLIMDEVQSLFKPSGSSQDYIKAANWLRTELTNAKYKKHMYVFALTGTPGGTVADILSVVNFVRPLNVPRIRPEDLNKHPEWLKGFVSYVELRGDSSVYGNKNVQNIFSEMDPKYYAGFLRTIKTLKDSDLKAEKRPGYMKNAIGAGDALTTQTAIKGLYSPDEIERLVRRDMTGGIPAAVKFGPKLSILSPKLREVIKRVLSTPGKQYMYVINAATAFTIMAVLDSMGYSGFAPGSSPSSLSPGKRYAFYKSGSYTYKGKTIKVEAKQLNAMKKALADKANINGDNIKLVLATGTYYQGLDTPGLTGVHIVDPLHDVSADIQAVGRALRMCGHSKSNGKNAQIFRYFSTIPRTFAQDGISKKQLPDLEKSAKKIMQLNLSADLSTVDGPPPGKLPPGVNSYVFADAVRRNTPVAQTERLLKAMAVDCKIFKDVFHSKENFQCGRPNFVDVTSSKSPRSPMSARSPSGLIQLSPLTPRSSPKTSSLRKSPSPARMYGKARYSPTGRERFGSASRRSPKPSRHGGSAMARFDLPNDDPMLRRKATKSSVSSGRKQPGSSSSAVPTRPGSSSSVVPTRPGSSKLAVSARPGSAPRRSPSPRRGGSAMAKFDLPNVDPRLRKSSPSVKVKASGKARSPFTDTGKVDAKKRGVLRDSKGRTYVRQGDKKVYVKKLYTPK